MTLEGTLQQCHYFGGALRRLLDTLFWSTINFRVTALGECNKVALSIAIPTYF